MDYFDALLFPTIESLAKKTLTHVEKQYIVNLVKQINPEHFAGKNAKEITLFLAQHVIQSVKMNLKKQSDELTPLQKQQDAVLASGDNPNITDEYFRNLLGLSSLFGGGSEKPFEISKFIGIAAQQLPSIIKQPVAVKTKKAYLFLDSKYRIANSRFNEVFSWSYFNESYTMPGTTAAVSKIKDIIAIKVYPIRLPAFQNASGYPHMIAKYKSVNMLIEEFSGQSLVASNGLRYHFQFSVTPTSDGWYDLRTLKQSRGEFVFNKPITTLNTISLSFSSPRQKITTFYQDHTSSTTSGGNPATIAIDPQSNPPVVLNDAGNRVSFSNFIYTDPALKSVQDALGRQEGFTISAAPPTNVLMPVRYYYNVPVDISGAVNIAATEYYINTTGTVSYTAGSNVLTGTGTLFMSELSNGDIILVDTIVMSVVSITSDTQLTTTHTWTSAKSGSAVRKQAIGTVSAVAGSVYITGIGTNFLAYLVGDIINTVNDQLTIEKIVSSTAVVVKTPATFSATTAFVMYRSPMIGAADIKFTTYYESTRLLVPLEITMLEN
jgi:hypothetical protein